MRLTNLLVLLVALCLGFGIGWQVKPTNAPSGPKVVIAVPSPPAPVEDAAPEQVVGWIYGYTSVGCKETQEKPSCDVANYISTRMPNRAAQWRTFDVPTH